MGINKFPFENFDWNQNELNALVTPTFFFFFFFFFFLSYLQFWTLFLFITDALIPVGMKYF